MSEKSQVPERYKKTELGIVPVEWEVEKLEDCCNKITDGSHFSPKSVEESDYKIATIANIDNNRFDLKSCKNISKDEYEKLVKNGCKPNIGDVLFSKDGTVGLCLVYKQEANLVLLSSIAIIPPKRDALESDFCAHMLKSDLILNEIIGRKTGTAIRRVVLRDLKTVKVPIPPIPEQQKIASILSKVDEQIEQTEQIIEKTETLKKGLMQKLLTKGIGHTKFKKTELGEIPEEWKMIFLDEVADVIDPHPSHRAPKIVLEGYPFAGIGDILEDGTILTEKCRKVSEAAVIEQEKSFTIDNDIGFGRVGTVGKVVWLKKQTFRYSISPTLSVIKPKTINRHYLFYAIKSEIVLQQINNFITGSTRESIGIMKLRKIKISVPSPEEQQKIASILLKVDSQIQDNQNYLTRLQELKKGLMQDLLIGKVRVCV